MYLFICFYVDSFFLALLLLFVFSSIVLALYC